MCRPSSAHFFFLEAHSGCTYTELAVSRPQTADKTKTLPPPAGAMQRLWQHKYCCALKSARPCLPLAELEGKVSAIADG